MGFTYSTQAFLGSLPAGLQVLYTVPSGNVFVVRSLYFYGNTSGPAQFSVGVYSPGASALLVFANPLAAGATATWEGRAVMNAGQTLQSNSSLAGVELIASGYLLSAV